MQPDSAKENGLTSKTFIDAMIRIGLIAALTFYCVQVFSPFLIIMLWGLILAIMLYPLHQILANRMGDRQGRASTLLVVALCVLLVVPSVIFGNSLVGHIQGIHTAVTNNELTIEKPGPKVAEWPIIGKRVYTAWSKASDNLPEFLDDYKEQLRDLSRKALKAAKSVLGAVFQFIGALIIAGIMMAWANPGSNAMKQILIRMAGPDKGAQLQTLSVATVRSVATGVLGVALIQAILFAIGFTLAKIPGASILALIVLLMGIIQLPAAIVALPVIIYMWTAGDASVVVNIGFTIYFVLAGLSDNVLKPMLLGRGVEAPMPIILIGALGGMVSGGFIGLFLGPILLAIGYQIFMAWVNESEQTDPAVQAIS